MLPDESSEAQRQTTARALSDLLLIPVSFERGGRVARCLELRTDRENQSNVKEVLAYRTAQDAREKAVTCALGQSGVIRARL